MYSKGQNEFVKGFVVFLLLVIPSGLLFLLLIQLAPVTALAAIPNWALKTIAAVWAVFCSFAPFRLKNQKWVQRWLWNKE